MYCNYQDWARGVREYVLAERIFRQKLEVMPGLVPQQNSRTRRSEFRGVRLLDPGSGDLFEPRRNTLPVNQVPREPVLDPCDEWER